MIVTKIEIIVKNLFNHWFYSIQILTDVHDLKCFSWTSVILLFYAVNELLSVETKIYECYAFAMIFLRNTDPQNGHIPYRRSERRLLNSLVFTSSAVENYWKNETLISWLWKEIFYLTKCFKVLFFKNVIHLPFYWKLLQIMSFY